MRKDYARLQYVEGKLKEIYSGYTLDISYGEEEDYGIDYSITASTDGYYSTGQTEVKSISTKYGDVYSDYFIYSSTTDPSLWRWCESGTQETITSDNTPYPEHLRGKRLVILNDYKFYRLKEARAGLIYLDAKGLLIFSNRQLLQAEEGHGWLKCRKTKEFGDRHTEWERKTILNIEKGRYYPIDDVPIELLK